MKNILIVSKVDKVLTRAICTEVGKRKEMFTFNFVAGIPIDVPEEYAEALLKTYPGIYSRSDLTEKEVEKLIAELPVEEFDDVEEVEEAPIVGPFVAKGVPEKIGEHFPVEKTEHTEEALLEMYNKDLVVIYKKNVGQDIAENTKKTDLVAMILKAQVK